VWINDAVIITHLWGSRKRPPATIQEGVRLNCRSRSPWNHWRFATSAINSDGGGWKSLSIDRLGPDSLLRRQSSKLILSRALGQGAVVLLEKAKQQIETGIRKSQSLFNACLELVIALKEQELFRQVPFDRLGDAFEQELDVRCRVEVAVEISRLIQDFDIMGLCFPPPNEGQDTF
jgi:hypothetical protein